MRKVRAALYFVDAINERFGKIIAFLILGMMGAMGVEVVLRYGFNSPTLWAQETAQFLYGSYCILGGGYALLHNAHVRMDVIYARFSLRKKAILDLATSSLFFLFIGVLLWKGLFFAWKSVSILEATQSVWAPPVWPVKLTLPLATLLILLQGIVKFVRDIETAVTGKENVSVVIAKKETL